MVLSSFLPYVIFILTVLISITRRTSRGLCWFVFLGMQQVLCDATKIMIAQARPPGACSIGFGLPSNHSSMVAAISTWLLLEWFLLEKNAPFRSWRFHKLLRNLALLFAPFVAISRHHLNYHTPGQILAGMMVGFCSASSVFAVLYYIIASKADYSNTIFAKIWTKLGFTDNIISKTKSQ